MHQAEQIDTAVTPEHLAEEQSRDKRKGCQDHVRQMDRSKERCRNPNRCGTSKQLSLRVKKNDCNMNSWTRAQIITAMPYACSETPDCPAPRLGPARQDHQQRATDKTRA